MTRRIRILITLFSFILFIGVIIFLNKKELIEFSKNNFGGNIVNNTSSSIKIIENNKIKEIPANKSSKEMKIFDVDYIIIEKPTSIINKDYSDGVLKICDFASISVKAENDKNIFEVLPSSVICKLIDDFEWFSKEEINIIVDENTINK